MGAGPESLEDFDRGRFAGSVGAKQAEDLAGVDFEIDAADRFEIAVGLAQSADFNDR